MGYISPIVYSTNSTWNELSQIIGALELDDIRQRYYFFCRLKKIEFLSYTWYIPRQRTLLCNELILFFSCSLVFFRHHVIDSFIIRR